MDGWMNRWLCIWIVRSDEQIYKGRAGSFVRCWTEYMFAFTVYLNG